MRKYLIFLIILCCFSLARGQSVPFSPQQFNDETWRIFDNGDPTKRMRFEASGLTTGITRTLTLTDVNMALIDWTACANDVNTTGTGRFDGGVGVGVDPTGADMLSVYKNSGDYGAVKIKNDGTGDALVTFYDSSVKWILGYDSTDGSFKIDQNIAAAGFTGTQDFVLDTSGNITSGAYNGATISGGSGSVDMSADSGAESFGCDTPAYLYDNTDGFGIYGGTVKRDLIVTGGDWTLDQSVASGAAPTFNNLKIEGGIPILIFKDSTDTGDSARGFQEWRDSNNVRLGFFGNSSYTHDDLVWKNESSGGHLLLETTGTGIVSSNTDFTTTGDLTAAGFTTAGTIAAEKVGARGVPSYPFHVISASDDLITENTVFHADAYITPASQLFGGRFNLKPTGTATATNLYYGLFGGVIPTKDNFDNSAKSVTLTGLTFTVQNENDFSGFFIGGTNITTKGLNIVSFGGASGYTLGVTNTDVNMKNYGADIQAILDGDHDCANVGYNYGVYITTTDLLDEAPASAINSYTLYLKSMANTNLNGGESWGIYSESDVVNAIHGKLRIGSTVAPTVALDIDGTIKIKEQANADADTAGYGQLWTKDNAGTTELWFTDDAGNDHQIAYVP